MIIILSKKKNYIFKKFNTNNLYRIQMFQEFQSNMNNFLIDLLGLLMEP